MRTTTGFSDKIREVAVETFEMMSYMFPLEDSEVSSEQQVLPDDMVASVVRFDGAAKGGMVLRATPDFVTSLAVNMLGIEEASEEQKEGALCEIVNIICGNVAPLFKKGEEICYIRPPRIAGPEERPDDLFRNLCHESVIIHLDEGTVEILVYYTRTEEAV